MQVTSLAAFGRPPAVPGRARLSSRPRRLAVGALLLGAAAAVGLTVSLAALPAQAVLAVALPASVAVLLAVRAPRTAAPAGWRWFAAALVLVSAGAAVAATVLGPMAIVVGTLPGRLLCAGAFLGLYRGCWRTSRARLLSMTVMFLLAGLLAVHETFELLPLNPYPTGVLRGAVEALPVVVSLATAAALLLAAGTPPARRRVAFGLLGAQSLFSAAAICSLVSAATGSPGAHTAAWPVALAGFTLLILACLRDTPLPHPPAAERPMSDATDLLPHAMALVAGTLFVARGTLAHHFELDDGVLALLMLLALVAHQAVMWTTQRRLTRDLRRSESFFRTLVKSSVDPVVILDDQFRVSFASPALWNLLGVDPTSTVGRHLREVIHPDDAPLFAAALTQPGAADSAVRTARLRHADGSWRLIQCTVRDLRMDPDVGALVVFCRDVTPRTPVRNLDPELLELSLTDPVTGLPNRTALVRRLGGVQRGDGRGRPASLALIGVTGLAGAEAFAPGTQDAVLRALTARLTRALRGEDWLARGKDGDFVVLVEGSIADAEVVASRLVANVGSIMTSAGPIELTAAAGVTGLPPDVDPGEALRRCGVALRSAQCAGTRAVHRYDDALRIQQDRSDALRADLDGAVERGELRLVFQPVVDLALRRTVSVEALLRWRHPVFGDVPPVEFVPLAEESALIGDLGRWVLREACAAVAALRDADLAVAVNISARQVRSGELVADVLAALGASGLPASRLIVEITESILMDDAHVIEDLAVLRRLGVRIAVDDFGTGWSSLAYLVGLPIDVLKMDQHFVAGVEHDAQRQALCRAVLQLGSSLGLPVIVEGVTSEAELALLRDMGHRFLQGFVFSRPLEGDQLAAGAWRAGGTPPAPVAEPRAEVAGSPPVVAP
jgi:PAS domain S-box-containing protein